MRLGRTVREILIQTERIGDTQWFHSSLQIEIMYMLLVSLTQRAKISFLIFFLGFYVYGCFAYISVYVPHVCLVS